MTKYRVCECKFYNRTICICKQNLFILSFLNNDDQEIKEKKWAAGN